MKWILFFLIVTSDGVTESHSYFETQELCELAAEEIQLKYHTNAKAIVTSCTHADGDEVPIWQKQ